MPDLMPCLVAGLLAGLISLAGPLSGVSAAKGISLTAGSTIYAGPPALPEGANTPAVSNTLEGANTPAVSNTLEGANAPVGTNPNSTRDIPDSSGTPQPLREVIRYLESDTGYRFLYRDALVSGKQVRFEKGDDWKDAFSEVLRSAGLDVRLDDDRRQAVIFQADRASTAEAGKGSMLLRGYVIDDRSGERLPFATVVLVNDESETGRISPERFFRGAQADIHGQFYLQVSATPIVRLRISYIGYHSYHLALTWEELVNVDEIAVRLESAPYQGKEIVVEAPMVHRATGAESTANLVLDGFSPAGESNTIRMLQTLPAVGLGTALSDGAFVRGSNADALQVLLDGSVVYNQAHLFGLVDSFNADAIRTSSFYYDVTPARYQGPPGGTLNLVTRSGSLYRYKGNAGVSSSAMSGSLEGPLLTGRASVLFSARSSLLNSTLWPDTGDLVAWGLDIGRPNSLDDDITILEDRIVTPGDFNVVFHDLHGKVFAEDERGNRWMLGGYSGYNNTRQDALRLVRTGPGQTGAQLTREPFETRNRWGNRSASIGLYRPLRQEVRLQASSGISYYHTRYQKEDFPYQRPGRNAQNQLLFFHDFQNQSELTHWYIEADVHQLYPFRDGATSDNAKGGDAGGEDEATGETAATKGATAPGDAAKTAGKSGSGYMHALTSMQWGGAIHGYRAAYLEESLNRSRYFMESSPLLAEAFLDTRWAYPGWTGYHGRSLVEAEAGLRVQYFSAGDYTRLSPRLQADFFPGSTVSAGLGYSRTYQYLYRLAFYNQTTSDIWITANESQKPSAADSWSASLRIRPTGFFFLTMEAYYKRLRNLRFHEINIQSVQSPLDGAPWFADNTGHVRGMEFQTGVSGRWGSLTQSWTLSRVEQSNSQLNEGERFIAYWDRTHQFNTLFSLTVVPRLQVNMNWYYASGVPDRLDLFRNGASRLGVYSRIDLSVRYERLAGSNRWVFEAGVYNLANRKNPWYRDWVLTVEEERQQRRLEPVQADYYDLGFQPSFSLRYYFDP